MNLKTPLYQSLKQYTTQPFTSFHMPVHSAQSPACDVFGAKTIALDTTELSATDNLANPEGCILEAHLAAASAFRCEFAHFLVGGSTAGIQAMLLYACKRGDTVIIDRCAHTSVINACAMFDLHPVFVERELLPGSGIPAPLTADKVQAAINSHPTASVVLVTSPTYYGINSDLRTIAEIVHNHSMLLLADAAHGSHYAFCPEFPDSAIHSGADICTVSLHKTLGALTQTALLLANHHASADGKLKAAINMVQTSSPSYLLMCSAELSIADMYDKGSTVLPELASLVSSLTNELQSHTLLRCLPAEGVDSDPLRLTISCAGYAVSGYELAQQLHNTYQIDVEMADLEHIVCIIGPYTQEKEIRSLESALIHLTSLYPRSSTPSFFPSLPDVLFKLPPAEAFSAASELVPLLESCGRICTDNLCVYPPGSTVVACGCEITSDILEYLETHIKRGGRVIGLQADSLVRVVKMLR